MIKNKAFLIFVATLFLNFCLINISFANEPEGIKNKYPDYSYEFTGQDSFENFNRKIFAFNLKANKYVIRPVNIVWASIMPQYGMDRLQNFYTNLNFPVRLAGCLLQKDFESSKSETVRFLTNTTLGFAGLYDPAKNKFKIEPRQEDMEQALAYRNVKRGPYIVLPLVAQGNARDIAGQILDLPLNPCSYIIGPVALASTGVSLVNGTAYMQPIFKMADDYADPYEVSKQLYGIERYIKNSNLDREDVLAQKTTSQNIVKISNVVDNSAVNDGLKADIKLNNYNPQGPLIDAMRTIFFDKQNLNDSIWSDLSVWNKSFSKKIKTSSVNIDYAHPNYKYRYILQKDKTSPIAIIYPSIGENIMSSESMVQAKILYDEGYSVVILGSSLQWEFVESMPDNYRPGLPFQDAYYLRKVTSKILTDVQIKTSCRINKKILVGSSFGGLTTLFVAAQEESDNTLGISNYISINPPIEMFFSLQQVDKYCQDWKNNLADIKLRAAMAAQKAIQVSENVSDKMSKPGSDLASETLPFTNDEAELAMSFVMKQKLSDVIFTIENNSTRGSTPPKSDLYKTINNMSFHDYAQKYLISNQNKSFEQLNYDSSLYSLADFLRKNKKYKIYHSLDDCFVNREQLIWLKQQSGNKSVFFSNGSHLGFLYREEFINQFKKDINIKNIEPKEGL